MQFAKFIRNLGLLIVLLFSDSTGQELKWCLYPSPTTANLDRIKMLSPSLGFIVSKDSGLFEYNGKQWKRFLPSLPAKISDVYAFDATSRENIWVSIIDELDQPILYHFNGKHWQKKYVGENVFHCISFTSPRLGLLSGLSAFGVYNGTTFDLIEPPTVFDITRAFAVAKDNFFALEANAPSNIIWLYHYRGGGWEKERSVSTIVRGVHLQFESPSRGLLRFDDTLFYYSNNKWQVLEIDTAILHIKPFSMIHVNDIWGIWDERAIVHYDGEKWTAYPTPQLRSLTSISMLSSDEGWAVGSSGVILHYSRQTKEVQQSIESIQSKTKKLFQPWLLGKLDVIGTGKRDEYGAAMTDVDGNGRLDVFTVSFSLPDRLYINNWRVVPNDNEWMKEEAQERRVAGASSMTRDRPVFQTPQDIGCAFADVDNDGSQDLFVTGYSMANQLYLNDGKGYFTEIARERRVTGDSLDKSNAVIFGDVNNDGNLDLFVTNQVGTNHFYRGDGTGHFVEMTDSFGLHTERGGQGATFGDVNEDGFLDVVVANWSLGNFLYINQHGKKFIEAGESLGVAGKPYWKSNGVVLFDVDNDGDLDVFFTNRATSNRLYINDGKAMFQDATDEWRLRDSSMSYGVTYGDFDNDGDFDLIVANVGENVFYRNEGKHFVNVTGEIGAEQRGYNTGMTAGDIDNDGDLDFYAACRYGDDSRLFENLLYPPDKQSENDTVSFLQVKVVGTKSNRDGIDAKLWLYDSGYLDDVGHLVGYSEVNAGSGYCSMNSIIQHFGVKRNSQYDLRVLFPATGILREVKNITAGLSLEVWEQDRFPAIIKRTQKAATRLVLNPQTHLETVKFLAVIALFIPFIRLGRRKFPWKWRQSSGMFAAASLIYWIEIALSPPEQVFFHIILPFASTGGVLYMFYLLYDNNVLGKISKEKLALALITKLQAFFHGEWALSNLNRLALLAKNIPMVDSGNPAQRERLQEAVHSFETLVLKELQDIHRLGKLFGFRSLSLRTLEDHTSQLLEEIRLLGNKDLAGKIAVGIPLHVEEIRRQLREMEAVITVQFSCNPLEIIKEVAEEHRSNFQQAGIVLTLPDDESENKVLVKDTELSHIIDNLLQNAYKAMAGKVHTSDSAKRRVTVSMKEFHGKYILYVQDTGEGISKDKFETIFDTRFSRGSEGGFGLGYAREVLKQYGGAIYVHESSVGKGTTFAVELRRIQ